MSFILTSLSIALSCVVHTALSETTSICANTKECMGNILNNHYNNLDCDGLVSCFGSIISQTNALECNGRSSCAAADISYTNQVKSNGYYGMAYTTIDTYNIDEFNLYLGGYLTGVGSELVCRVGSVCNVYCENINSCHNLDMYCLGECSYHIIDENMDGSMMDDDIDHWLKPNVFDYSSDSGVSNEVTKQWDEYRYKKRAIKSKYSDLMEDMLAADDRQTGRNGDRDSDGNGNEVEDDITVKLKNYIWLLNSEISELQKESGLDVFRSNNQNENEYASGNNGSGNNGNSGDSGNGSEDDGSEKKESFVEKYKIWELAFVVFSVLCIFFVVFACVRIGICCIDKVNGTDNGELLKKYKTDFQIIQTGSDIIYI